MRRHIGRITLTLVGGAALVAAAAVGILAGTGEAARQAAPANTTPPTIGGTATRRSACASRCPTRSERERPRRFFTNWTDVCHAPSIFRGLQYGRSLPIFSAPARGADAMPLSTALPLSHERRLGRPSCPRCGEVLVVAETTEFLASGHVRHTWHCDACEHDFATKIRLRTP